MTQDIAVSVIVTYQDDESQPENERFIYSYAITILNNGDQPAQLISRYWKITDSDNRIQEVQGLGVVGEQPTLNPGQSYQYTSGVVIETESGIMQGFYKMRDNDGSEFDADIPAFALVKPSALH